MDSKRRTTCPRIVPRHKYEKLSKNNQIWWNNKFKELEDDIRAPKNKKYFELKNLYTTAELKDLEAAGLTFGTAGISEKHRDTSKRRKTAFKSTVYIPPRRISMANKSDLYTNQLIEFFKKSPEEAKVWSPKQKREIDETVGLVERATLVEEELAEDFDNWFNNIKSYSTSELNKETILNIFEINSSLPINKSVVVNMKQINSVPDQVAKYLGIDELADSAVVKRELDSDIKAATIKPNNTAFGTMLPPSLRKVKYTATNKIKVNSDHKDLETFAAVFKDIMELETSQGFVKWLRKNSNITPPQFLQKTYMISKKKAPRKTFYLRQVYEAKVWSTDKSSESSSSVDSPESVSLTSADDSYSFVNYIV